MRVPNDIVRIPRPRPGNPALAIAKRVAFALALVLVNWLLVVVEKDGYRDAVDGQLSLIDALYYTTVTLTTTGYGDIVPVTQSARLVNALLVTPMRLLFLLVLVGTTVQALTERSREQLRLSRWRLQLHDHVIVCGFGTKGRSAARTLLEHGWSSERIVVVDPDGDAVRDANALGFVAVQGSATTDEVLIEAGIARAGRVIVATNRDDTAVLATLSARKLNATVPIVATVRESENADLLEQSGATSVITSSASVGRLLGLATEAPRAVELVQDLLQLGRGLDLVERPVAPDEVGRSPRELADLVLGVARSGSLLVFDDPAADPLRADDRVVVVNSERSRT
ncbi:MAG: Ion channel protein [Frankiales bacterium]|nr:Ion channel protein [Frankiales bacterium]